MFREAVTNCKVNSDRFRDDFTDVIYLIPPLK